VDCNVAGGLSGGRRDCSLGSCIEGTQKGIWVGALHSQCYLVHFLVGQRFRAHGTCSHLPNERRNLQQLSFSNSELGITSLHSDAGSGSLRASTTGLRMRRFTAFTFSSQPRIHIVHLLAQLAHLCGSQDHRAFLHRQRGGPSSSGGRRRRRRRRSISTCSSRIGGRSGLLLLLLACVGTLFRQAALSGS
jgi:hypothetical protein